MQPAELTTIVLPSSPSPLLYCSPLFQAVLVLMVVLVVVRQRSRGEGGRGGGAGPSRPPSLACFFSSWPQARPVAPQSQPFHRLRPWHNWR